MKVQRILNAIRNIESPPVSTAPAGERMPALDGVRGIAILSVLTYHTWSMAVLSTSIGASPGRVYSYIASLGWMGVDLFFVLSGFLITGILYDSRARLHYYRVFYARRAIRIFPLYYASLFLMLVIIPAVVSQRYANTFNISHQWVAWLYLLNWNTTLHLGLTISPLIGHFWSLCVEEQFYLLWPYIVKTFARRLFPLTGGVIIAALTLRVIAYKTGVPQAAYLTTVCRMDSLALGAMLALAYRSTFWQRVRQRAFGVLSCSLLLLALLVITTQRAVFGRFEIDTLGISLAGLISASFVTMVIGSTTKSVVRQVVSASPLRFFGRYSYGIYVVHQPIIYGMVHAGAFQRIVDFVPNPLYAILLINAVAFGMAVAGALLSWNLLEKHFLRLKERDWFTYSGVTEAARPLAVAAKSGG